MALVFALLLGFGVRESLRRRHAVLRNYPVIGHLRFLLEYIRPEIECVYRFHRNTLEALKELVQAAALEHRNQIRAAHIIAPRR